MSFFQRLSFTGNKKKTVESGKGLALRSKLLLMLLASSMSAILVMAVLDYQHGGKELRKTVSDKLTAIRVAKTSQIEWYFNSIRSTVSVLGTSLSVREALMELNEGFNLQLSDTELSKDSINKLNTYYQKEYLPRLEQVNKGGNLIVELFWPRSQAGRVAQSRYIAENKNKVGEKDEMFKSSDNGVYDEVHAKHHGFFRDAIRRLKFYDIFLIDGETGNIVYSVYKEADYGTNLLKGPYAHTSLGRLFQRIKDDHQKGGVLMTDFQRYAPSYNVPSAFVGTPVYSEKGKFVGVLAAQFSLNKLNSFLKSSLSWEEEGLGKTGQVYLVGDDKLMRTNSRFLEEDKKAYIASLKKSNMTEQAIKEIDALNTSVLLHHIDTDAVRNAFEGQTNVTRMRDFKGDEIIASYAPLDIPDLRWAFVSEMSEAEAMRPQREYGRKLMITSAIILLLMTLASILLSTLFLKPVNALVSGIRRVNDGEQNVRVQRQSNDEIGELTEMFNTMTTQIDQRDGVIAEQTASYESLLFKLYPTPIAERMKLGESKIVMSSHQISVMFVIIHNFSKMTEGWEAKESLELLNEIVDSFDEIGESMGVEKVKTIGEHYLAVCGLSVPSLDHARRGLDYIHALGKELALINARHDIDLALRVGMHSGPIKAGLIGSRTFTYDIWGMSLNIARRIVYEAAPNMIRISTQTYHMLNAGSDFGEEIVVETTALGSIATYEQDINMKVDSNRMAGNQKRKTSKKDQAGGLLVNQSSAKAAE